MAIFDDYCESCISPIDDSSSCVSFFSFHDDELSFDCSNATFSIFSDIIDDDMTFVHFTYSPESLYDCVAFNTTSLEASVYNNIDYNSFAVFGDSVFAANDLGIFIMDSDTDNGAVIHTGVVLPKSYLLDNLADKRVRMCFVNCYGSQPIFQMTALSTRSDPVVEQQQITNAKSYFSRLLRGKEFEVRIADFDSLLSIEFFLTVLTR